MYDRFLQRFNPKSHLTWFHIELKVVPLAWQAKQLLKPGSQLGCDRHMGSLWLNYHINVLLKSLCNSSWLKYRLLMVTDWKWGSYLPRGIDWWFSVTDTKFRPSKHGEPILQNCYPTKCFQYLLLSNKTVYKFEDWGLWDSNTLVG